MIANNVFPSVDRRGAAGVGSSKTALQAFPYEVYRGSENPSHLSVPLRSCNSDAGGKPSAFRGLSAFWGLFE